MATKLTKTTRAKTTKKAAKKVAKKTTKRVTKAAKKDLVYAEDQHSFWVTNGEILNSLTALKDALETMEKSVYQYHAKGDQNDFSVWVNEVLADQACAKDLEAAATPKQAKTIVVRHLKYYR